MRNIFLTLIFTVFLGVGLGSCATLEDFFGEGTVFTTSDQVEEGGEAAIIPWDQLPDSVKDLVPEGTNLVMTTKDALVDGATYIPAGGELDEGGYDGLVSAALGIATAFVPGLAAWEGMLLMFSKRKRKHYVKAAKSLIPTDKNMDLGGAIGSLAAALGITHSSENSAAAFEDDEEEGDLA